MERHQRADKVGGAESGDRDQEAPVSTRPLAAPIHSFAIDDIAMMSLRERTMLSPEEKTKRCDVCGKPAGDDASSGLFMWVRDEDYRFEEPAICKACSRQVSTQAYLRLLGPEE